MEMILYAILSGKSSLSQIDNNVSNFYPKQ